GGFIVLHDPLRADVKGAIRTAREAGTRVIMLTGDNAVTAAKIAHEAGIAPPEEQAIAGEEIERMDDQALTKALAAHH
ncbi:cation-transporting P-type ATPase, partial [candidate division KSB1 bacterium]|nr:cation-transporting P-type ATPase [candidate division KSB1 bacterium]NIT72220.1 cation-transporting P-type ATPase [candidate division KSB1 bacterium]NIW70393.1 HAD family hydrolase [candidate division KSB1 bacterium]NIX71900.1 HAD family hydrolase [candidate division KSB1 bacterium]